MTFSLPIPTFKGTRPTPQRGSLVRVVPEPKTFVMKVAWEETVAKPLALSVRRKSSSQRIANPAARILRLTVPLELRLDPTL